MTESEPRDEMMDYLENWAPAKSVVPTTNGVLVETQAHDHTGVVHRLYAKYGWVIDQVHWETDTMHLVPREVVDDD